MNKELQKQVKDVTRKYYNAQRQNRRHEKVAADAIQKMDLEAAKLEASRLRGTIVAVLGQDLLVLHLKPTKDESISLLQARIQFLFESHKHCADQSVALLERRRQIGAVKRKLKMAEKARNYPDNFRMVHKRRYFAVARRLAAFKVSIRAAEAKVGAALVEVDATLGHHQQESLEEFLGGKAYPLQDQ